MLLRSKCCSAELLLRVHGARSYALCKPVKYSHIYTVHMSPDFNGNSVLQCFKPTENTRTSYSERNIILFTATRISCQTLVSCTDPKH